MKAVNHEWFGLILDIGSYQVHDPYEEISKTIQYVVHWQVKERMLVDGKEVDVDLKKLVRIIKASSYRAYLPVETLGAGDPKEKIKVLVEKLGRALSAS